MAPPKAIDITIKTLTPLWTGGIDGKCDRIHETGILGSLRWWMEVLVRGMGGNACDPTEQKCSAKNGLCPVCQLFGAEGQKRRFRLEIQETNISDAAIKHPIAANLTYTKNSNQKTPTWYFPDPTQNTKPQPANTPKQGTFILKIQSLHPDFKPEIIGGLIQFIADWSALGARPQMGFGVIQVEGSRIDTQDLYDWLKKVEGEYKYPELPSLHNIFLAKIQPKAFTETDTFNLKYDLRQLFRPQAGKPDNLKSLRHFIMGTVKNDRRAAKIKISRPYDEHGTAVMRVWGWIPETETGIYPNGWDREKVVEAIYHHLTATYTLHEWREMNSARDTVKTNESSAQSFLCSLLKAKESSNREN
ncbi:CRISPR-associated protein, Cmr1 family [Leptolyngbyaceae cyanobacterium JSC-12]|nr:CRISPR-associated protein, Cmr1 family [Leptolyngbyaceae cyanobacterium JSC-12]